LDADQISELKRLDPADSQYATSFATVLIAAARRSGASDIHLQPTPDGLSVRMRVDGVLVPLGVFSPGASTNIVVRLKVLSSLLTYRTDVPQEGRIQSADQNGDYECRVSTFPTLHGERAVIRMFTGKSRFRRLDDLHLPHEILTRLRRLLGETSGAILITGPAGSGKTTTLYACLNELVDEIVVPRSIVTLEDPIEMVLPGVSQSQVNDAAGFNLATAVRSVLRQDPEVIMVGEIRDRPTAEAALQASLTGQLVLSSFHAGSAAAAVRRLLDMGLEPYALRSGLLAILFQRLVRQLCDCSREAQDEREFLGLPVQNARIPIGCAKCGGTGYRGRLVLAETLPLTDDALGMAILERAELAAIEQRALDAGMIDRWSRARAAVERGATSPAEIRRVLGFSRVDDE
jgi:type II secretory ATPase GspE/PulE/Tfp pilus assembly ATPase PilB-like protein